MRAMPIVATLGALCLATACASPWPPEPRLRDAPPAPANAAASVALEREVRYYRDEEGMVWDDRGRKLGHSVPPQPSAPR